MRIQIFMCGEGPGHTSRWGASKMPRNSKKIVRGWGDLRRDWMGPKGFYRWPKR